MGYQALICTSHVQNRAIINKNKKKENKKEEKRHLHQKEESKPPASSNNNVQSLSSCHVMYDV